MNILEKIEIRGERNELWDWDKELLGGHMSKENPQGLRFRIMTKGVKLGALNYWIHLTSPIPS